MKLGIVEQETSKLFCIDGSERTYRGTSRSVPGPFNQYSEDHPINIAKVELYTLKDDLPAAYRIFNVLQEYDPATPYELIGVTNNIASTSELDGVFLGFDVSLYGGFNTSLIRIALLFSQPDIVDSDFFDDDAIAGDQILAINKAVVTLFSDRINDVGLFNSPYDAIWFSQCIKAIDILRPNWYEGTNLMPYFEVVGVYSYCC